jgi:5-methylcytosine-specific restriction protein A
MPTNPFTRACAMAGCALPVARGGRCALHNRHTDTLRGLSSDRLHTALYHSARWRRLRLAILAEHPLCQCLDCAASNTVLLATVVHHTRPHHGREALFFDETNLQPLSKACHNRLTGRGRRHSQGISARHGPRLSVARETLSFPKGV